MLSSIAIAGGGFLLAVLWLDLMFDVQVLGRDGNVQSIADYYRRVTTDASPMGYLVAVVMVVTVASLAGQATGSAEPRWLGALSLALAVPPIAVARVRTLPNAIRLGSQAGEERERRRLARAICLDHCYCFGSMAVFTLVRIAAPLLEQR